MSPALKVCIDARHATFQHGGSSTFVLSLARALAQLSDGDEEYSFLVNNGGTAAFRAAVGTPVRVIEAAPESTARRIARKIQLIVSTWGRKLGLEISGREEDPVPNSDGVVEREGIDVLHFTMQVGFHTAIPFIYHPHDLQHRHLPEFFTPAERAWRESVYSTLCREAAVVAVVSKWGKEDLLRSFDLPSSKVQIVHLSTEERKRKQPSSQELGRLKRKLGLPERFLLYPARTWPHKNHLRLIRALHKLRGEEGMTIPLVCTGASTEFLRKLQAEIKCLKLREQIYFVGFVDFEELDYLYELCSGVVIPTLFEAGSFPLWEAFRAGRPVACSNVTSLPAQAGDAALVFDPYCVDEIADAMKRLWNDQALGDSLIARGRANISRYSWERTAKSFRAVYRQLGRRQLSVEDEELLSAPPLM